MSRYSLTAMGAGDDDKSNGRMVPLATSQAPIHFLGDAYSKAEEMLREIPEAILVRMYLDGVFLEEYKR